MPTTIVLILFLSQCQSFYWLRRNSSFFWWLYMLAFCILFCPNALAKDQRVEGRKMLTLENINCLLFSWYKCYLMDLSQANDKNELLLRRKMRLLTWEFLLFLLNIITGYRRAKNFNGIPIILVLTYYFRGGFLSFCLSHDLLMSVCAYG